MNFRIALIFPLFAVGIFNAMDKPLRLIPVTKPAAAQPKQLAPPMDAALGQELNGLLLGIHNEAYQLKRRPILTPEAIKRIRDLIQRNADVNGEHLLENAVAIGNIEIFTLILNKVTNPLAARRALIVSLLRNELQMAELILQKFDLNLLDTLPGIARPQYGDETGNDLIFEYLSALRCKKNVTGNKSQRDIARVVTFLIDHNLNSLRAVDGEGNTPLMVAAQMGLVNLVKLLLSYRVTAQEIQTEARSTSSYLNLLPREVLRMATQQVKPFANATQRNRDGQTALDLARQSLDDLGPKGNVQKKRALSDTIALLEAASAN